jgi:ABC-type polar amino acid transport system ATPase subunit
MIAVAGLVKRHGAITVLNGISLNVTRGEVAVLIGPSGGGKSTLLRCVNGLETFHGGSVHVDELTLGPDTARAGGDALRRLRQRVGMVFQQFNLFPHMSVIENVICGPRVVLGKNRDEVRPFAEKLLNRVGLADKFDARPGQLSGGQQQRVAIARALAMEPEAILFDEPTSALDPRMAAEVLAVITDLATSGQTMIVVTHAMGFAKQVAHKVYVMAEGRVAEAGPPGQVFEAPTTDVTRQFLTQARTT